MCYLQNQIKQKQDSNNFYLKRSQSLKEGGFFCFEAKPGAPYLDFLNWGLAKINNLKMTTGTL